MRYPTTGNKGEICMATKSNQATGPREAIAIPAAAWNQIVERLDQQGKRQHDSQSDKADRENRTRHKRVVSCILRLQQNDSPAAVYKVTTRNLSGGGLGFFFNQYLHPGTSCYFALADRHGTGRVLQGTVRWCRHVSNTLHECGVQFDVPIDPDEFVDLELAEVDDATPAAG